MTSLLSLPAFMKSACSVAVAFTLIHIVEAGPQFSGGSLHTAKNFGVFTGNGSYYHCHSNHYRPHSTAEPELDFSRLCGAGIARTHLKISSLPECHGGELCAKRIDDFAKRQTIWGELCINEPDESVPDMKLVLSVMQTVLDSQKMFRKKNRNTTPIDAEHL